MSPTANIPSLLVWKFSVFTVIFLPLNSISHSKIGPSFLFKPNRKINSSASYELISLVSKFLRVTSVTFCSPIMESIK